MANNVAVSETKCAYDVFLSFRGEDTRHTFTGKLYAALRRKGIITFMDDEELKRGDQLGPVLLKAIEGSRMWIVVFSENYADSSWCLDELVKIHECMNSTKQLVWPIFYKVDPSKVRHQKGSYGQAMTKHEDLGKDPDKVKKWRSALTEIANLKGDHLKEEQGMDESKFIEDFVWEIFIRLSPKDLSKNECIVGRENQVERLQSLLDLESRDISCALLGIHGAGGIGKTTIAKALYDSIYNKFEASSFLFNVRETSNQLEGLEKLQIRLLSEILEDEDSKIKLNNKDEGIGMIQRRLGVKRILIVLDDVDHIEQLNYLAGKGDWFGHGSRVIITTRNTQLLDQGGVQMRYEVKMLKHQESLELFCQSAFRKTCPESNYEELSNRAVRCCKGLPLALKVLGSHMVGKDFSGWKDALDRYEKSLHPDVQRVLRISYDSLHFNEKNIFLDIACFFKGQKLECVKRVLDSSDFSSGDGITTLVNKSLITVVVVKGNNGLHFLGMHDLIQEMGREIVKEEAPNEVGERSRLWHHDEVLQVLADNNGSTKIQGIVLHPPQREEIDCVDTVFEKMKNLRILIVRYTRFSQGSPSLPNNLKVLEWWEYPSESFPSGSYPRKIGSINLYGSRLLERLEQFQRCEHLTSIDISRCDKVTEFPDVSGALNLRELRLDECHSLVSIHESVGHLPNLVRLSAYHCYNLESFVPTIYLPSLEHLSFNNCLILAHFPEIVGMMSKPLKICISGTAIIGLPKSIKNLIGLNYLDMSYCTKLHRLPSSLFMLPNLVTLIRHMGREIVGQQSRLWHHDNILQALADNNGSTKIQEIVLDTPRREEIDCVDTVFEKMKNLRILNVRDTRFSQGPRSLPNNLKFLEWEGYPSESFPPGSYPRTIGSINLYRSPLLKRLEPFKRCERLTSIHIENCHTVIEFPDVSGAMNLRELRLIGCDCLVSIHESVGRLTNLVILDASSNQSLGSFVPIIYLPSLEYLSFLNCRRFTHFPEVEGMMDKPLKIDMNYTGIKELPESFEKLIGLNYLAMSFCRGLEHLPNSLFMLPNLVTLDIGACGQLRELFRRFEGSHSAYSRLETLYCNDVGVFDEHLDAIIYNFPNLRHLDVSGNEFVSVPERIEECTKLTSLNVENCMELQEIPKLPSNVKKVYASDCKSLTSKTSNMLWSQMPREIKRLQVVMPKTKIPEWLDYVNKEGGFPVFKARGKFPAVAIVFVFRKQNNYPHHVRMHLLIDGERNQYCRNFTVPSNHVLLCDLRVLLSSKELEDVAVGVGNNDWMTIQVCWKKELPISLWGLYVYKHETNMEDIQFMSHDPNSSLVSSLDAIREYVGPSSQQRNDKGLVEEDSSSEDVENVDGLNHNNPRPDIHIANTTCLAIWTVLKKLLWLCFS